MLLMQNTIKHVVFDIGRVLIHYDPHIPFHRIMPDEADRNWFFDNVCTHEWNLEQDRGRPWSEAEDLLIAQYPEQEANIRAFRAHWPEMTPHAYEDSVALMRNLIANGYDVTLLTNFASDTLANARQRFPFLNETRGITVSGDIQLLKPDREIYEVHSSQFGLDPASTLFIDDSPPNVAGAKAAGWNAVLFTDADTLRRDLKRFGLPA